MDKQKSNDKGQFKSNFGFLMAAVGSAVGLGNLWGFPYKMGNGGGFAFLILYLLMAIFIGYPCMLGEFSIGRKGQKAAIGSYEKLDKRFTFNGWIATIVPFFLLTFYCVLGGYVLKYLLANIGDIFGAGWGVNGADSGTYFGAFVGSGAPALIFTAIYIIVTVLIVMGGVSGGIEKFCTIAMPGLAILLIITVIRSCTLPGAAEGLEFIFKPNFEVFKGTGWITVLASAGGQIFFSLSLASACMIVYGSYLDKKENLEKNAILVPIMDTTVALLAALATIPATFAAGMEPAAGPGMLFVTLQTVFNSMGSAGPIFGTIFYLLVLFAALTSSIGMLEGAVSAFMDRAIDKGKKPSRAKISWSIIAITTIGSIIVAIDALGAGPLPKPFGLGTWLDAFDLFAEGFMMPGGCLIMTIILGWIHPNYIDDEVRLSSGYKSKAFVNFCLKWIAPIFLVFILVGQMNSFFAFGWF
ncbi:sodium-dependent transporter [Emergencia timonensis]|uniref:sodium-dependent transporter n=1 Tax=Emergencia timonensis TaxID=1776384 RepID=UPI00082D8472|nr:sodium-dependent transporter [Emergencia timonensis]WNX88430.1 sodium-dependent transporter [Emergencia timonensis]